MHGWSLINIHYFIKRKIYAFIKKKIYILLLKKYIYILKWLILIPTTHRENTKLLLLYKNIGNSARYTKQLKFSYTHPLNRWGKSQKSPSNDRKSILLVSSRHVRLASWILRRNSRQIRPSRLVGYSRRWNKTHDSIKTSSNDVYASI